MCDGCGTVGSFVLQGSTGRGLAAAVGCLDAVPGWAVVF